MPVRTISTPARNVLHTNATAYTITSTTAGDALVAVLAYFQGEGATVTGITGGGTWTQDRAIALDANSHLEIWSAPNVSGSVTSITVTTNDDGSPTVAMQVTVYHLSGMQTSAILDVNPTPATGSDATPDITTGTLAQANEVVIEADSHTGTTLTSMDPDTADGFTQGNEQLDNDNGQTFYTQYKVTTATTSMVVTTTYNAARAWQACVCSYKEASSGTDIPIPVGSLPLTGRVPVLQSDEVRAIPLGSLPFTGYGFEALNESHDPNDALIVIRRA